MQYRPDRTCRFSDCSHPVVPGLDRCHFHRHRRKCIEPDCPNQVYARSRCVRHGGKKKCQHPHCHINAFVGDFCARHRNEQKRLGHVHSATPPRSRSTSPPTTLHRSTPTDHLRDVMPHAMPNNFDLHAAHHEQRQRQKQSRSNNANNTNNANDEDDQDQLILDVSTFVEYMDQVVRELDHIDMSPGAL